MGNGFKMLWKEHQNECMFVKKRKNIKNTVWGLLTGWKKFSEIWLLPALLKFGDFLFLMSFLQGMELYPRIGKNFDIKVFTNCRFGMMSWGVLPLTYCIKQVDAPTFSLMRIWNYLGSFFCRIIQWLVLLPNHLRS